MSKATIDSDEHRHMGMAAVAEALQRARIEVEGYRRDAERFRWLTKDGRKRRWTFWMGYNSSATGYTVWPVFGGSDIGQAIDEAMEREAMRKVEAIQV